jgi:clan AA aspartic protease
MMTGQVVDLHAWLPVIFRSTNQPDLAINFVIDTGFTGFLTLPATAVAAMSLPFLHRIPADLADSSTIELDVYAATILWNGVERQVPLLAIGHRPLLGTSLLANSELLIQFFEDGLVSVNSSPDF